MKRPTVALVGVCLLFTSPALGQRMSDRIDHALRRQAPDRTALMSRADMLKVLTGTALTVQFNETPAREVFNYLQTHLGLHIVGRYSDDKIGHGIDPETPITLEVVGRSALTVVELVLAQCQELDPCTWQLRNGYVEVGTKERLSVPSARETRYYVIRDLMYDPLQFGNAPELNLGAALNQGGGFGGGGGGGGRGGGFGGGGGGGGRGGGGGGGGTIFDPPGEPPDRPLEEERVQEIITLITTTIEPDAWELNGWATIQYYAGTLIIRAPDYIHRRIDGYR
ncbi:MAG: hypothetical protein ACYS15_08320 [Planctomycetota bacterium]|jgi:uncharacterized membrane protein YgcG